MLGKPHAFSILVWAEFLRCPAAAPTQWELIMVLFFIFLSFSLGSRLFSQKEDSYDFEINLMRPSRFKLSIYDLWREKLFSIGRIESKSPCGKTMYLYKSYELITITINHHVIMWFSRIILHHYITIVYSFNCPKLDNLIHLSTSWILQIATCIF